MQVEVWLSRLLDTMRATVRDEMSVAVAAYEDKPRDQWLFDHPAQVLPLLLPFPAPEGSLPGDGNVSGSAVQGRGKGEVSFLLAIF